MQLGCNGPQAGADNIMMALEIIGRYLIPKISKLV
jgi:hypothetical protein